MTFALIRNDMPKCSGCGVTSISTASALEARFPVREMVARDWIRDGDSATIEAELIRFFRVRSVAELLGPTALEDLFQAITKPF